MKKKGSIFVISGPSGSGKTTLANSLLSDKILGKSLVRSISFTTRPKRTGEKNRKDYFFITKEEFQRKLKSKKILEWTKYLGYYYGTSKEFVDGELKKGKSIIFCLDLKGAIKLKEIYPKETVTVFVKASNFDELRQRISKRCSKTKKEEIQKRLLLAKKEIRSAARYDYCVINKELQRALDDLKSIVQKEIGA